MSSHKSYDEWEKYYDQRYKWLQSLKIGDQVLRQGMEDTGEEGLVKCYKITGEVYGNMWVLNGFLWVNKETGLLFHNHPDGYKDTICEPTESIAVEAYATECLNDIRILLENKSMLNSKILEQITNICKL